VAQTNTGEDKGIFVGKPHAEYPEVRKPNFLELGDQIVKVKFVICVGNTTKQEKTKLCWTHVGVFGKVPSDVMWF
jgi:hypothetical protein